MGSSHVGSFVFGLPPAQYNEDEFNFICNAQIIDKMALKKNYINVPETVSLFLWIVHLTDRAVYC